MTKIDSEITRALIRQVLAALQDATIGGMTEANVLTYVTRPMWEAFLRYQGLPEVTPPTPWQGVDTVRIFGSETIIVESEEWWSLSMIIEP
jgi:hypothetical protein